MRSLIQQPSLFSCATDQKKYDGWYPHLFYKSIVYILSAQGPPWFGNPDLLFDFDAGAGKLDALTADINTDFPCDLCDLDPGAILQEAVGFPNLLIIAVDNGPDRMVFAGPVLSHYEFDTAGSLVPWSDTDWTGKYINTFTQASFLKAALPPWTKGFLVPQ